MIVRDKPGILQLLFAVRGSVLPTIAPHLAVVIAVATGAVLIDHRFYPLNYANGTPFAVFGAALSLFLGFRNNAAYDRWWEARRLWGGLLADARTLARELEMFLHDAALRQHLLRLCLAFLHLHRAQLRRLKDDPTALAAAKAAANGADPTQTPNSPCAALNDMTRLLATAYADGKIDGFGARAISTRMASIALAQAACERIAGTPLPYVYSLLIFRTSWMYCLLLPLGLIDSTGWLTPLFAGIVAYTFFGLAEVTEELAHPFGLTANALPLDAICRAAEISLAPHLGEPAPPPLVPHNFRLD